MYTLGQLDEHNWACTLPTVLTRDVAKLAISFLSVLIPRKFDCLRSYLTLGRERNISPTINRSPVSFNLHVYNIKIVSLLLCTKGFKYHFSDTNSNYQHVVNSYKYIPKQWIGLKMCSDWLLKLQNFCYPPLSNSYGFALKNIAIVEGINELKSSFEQYYLTVVVYTQFKHISFQNIYSPQCQWPYQWIFTMRLFS